MSIPASKPIPSLTTHLLTLSPLGIKGATRAPFLAHAGRGTLSREVLQTWLAQDRLYAQAYVRFAALLLANVRLPSAVEAAGVEERCVSVYLSICVSLSLSVSLCVCVCASSLETGFSRP